MQQREGQEELPTPNEQNHSTKGVSRRLFLGLFGATVASAAANMKAIADGLAALPEPKPITDASVSPQIKPKEVVTATPNEADKYAETDRDEELKTAEQLQQEVEAEFGILLKRSTVFKIQTDGKVEEVQEPLERPWNQEQLIMLRKFLRKYPKSFLAPNEEDGTKMNIVLLEKPSDSSGKAYTRTDISNELDAKNHANLSNSISISNEVFSAEKPEQAWFILSHELTHKIEPVVVTHGNEYIGTIPYETIKAKSLWQEKLQEAFGSDEFQARQTLFRKVLMKYPEILTAGSDALMQPQLWQKGNDTFSERDMESFFARRMLYAAGLSKDQEELTRIGTINYYPSEFYGVLSESYVFGYDHFKKMYGDYFEPDVVDRLYAFTKDTIYEERQYRRNGKDIEYFDKAA